MPLTSQLTASQLHVLYLKRLHKFYILYDVVHKIYKAIPCDFAVHTYT
jgi:hypothetical protein